MTAVFKPGDRVRVSDGPFYGTVQVVTAEFVFVLWDDTQICGRHDHAEAQTFVRLEPAPASSPDTPEAGAATLSKTETVQSGAAGELDGLREALAAVFDEHDYLVFGAVLDALLPIIDRHTAKAINHAVMAQDTALETALRERDEAQQDLAKLQFILKGMIK